MKAETKVGHTPGPWRVTRASFEGCLPDEVAYFITAPGLTANAVDARLIAAAPALLEASRAALKALESPEAQHAIAFHQERTMLEVAISQALETP